MKTFICFVTIFLSLFNKKLCVQVFNPATISELYMNVSLACDPTLSPLLINAEINTGIISSPNFPPIADRTNRNNRFVCSWTIKAPKNYKIWIKFQRLSLDPQCKSRLSFYDGENSNSTCIQSFCERFSRDFETRKNIVHVVFESDTSYQNFGFQLYFKHVKMHRKCDGVSTFSCESDRECFSAHQICNQQFDCNDGKDEEKCFHSKPALERICGKSVFRPKLTNLNRIFGGDKAVPGSWPWTVSIRLRMAEPDGHMCGGVLIDYDWVLTAAHCFHKYTPDLWTVHIGRYNRIVDHNHQIVRHVEEIFAHKDYQKVESGSFYVPVNDIALIKLKSAVPFNNPFIAPICIPKIKETHVGRMSYATGWGLTRGTGFDLLLKQAMIPVISTKECHTAVPNMRNVINDRIICAGYKEGGDDTCDGDSGGPLAVFSNITQRWELIGITSSSSGIGCGSAMAPGFYTNVYEFLPFISETMRTYKLKRN